MVNISKSGLGRQLSDKCLLASMRAWVQFLSIHIKKEGGREREGKEEEEEKKKSDLTSPVFM